MPFAPSRFLLLLCTLRVSQSQYLRIVDFAKAPIQAARSPPSPQSVQLHELRSLSQV